MATFELKETRAKPVPPPVDVVQATLVLDRKELVALRFTLTHALNKFDNNWLWRLVTNNSRDGMNANFDDKADFRAQLEEIREALSSEQLRRVTP